MEKHNLKSTSLVAILGGSLTFATYLLVSSFWSTAFFDADYYYPLFLAFYLLGFGIGSLVLFARVLAPRYVFLFFNVSCVLAGGSLPFLRTHITHSSGSNILPIIGCLMAGLCAGAMLTIALRGMPEGRLSRLLFILYQASTLFGLAALLLLVPRFGYQQTAFLMAMAGATLSVVFSLQAKKKRWMVSATIVLALCASTRSLHEKGAKAEAARVIASQQTEFQRITLIEKEGLKSGTSLPQHVLFLDGFPEFSSADDSRYHLCFTHLPLSANNFLRTPVAKALVLGGGSGIVVRNLLANSKVREITVVEQDDALVRLATEELSLRMYNLDAFRQPKVRVINADPFTFVQKDSGKYDEIFIDIRLPRDTATNRYYTAEFYRTVKERLRFGGSLAVHAGPRALPTTTTSDQPAPVAAVLSHTLEQVGLFAYPIKTTAHRSVLILANASSELDLKFLRLPTNDQMVRTARCEQFENGKGFPTYLNTLLETEFPKLVRKYSSTEHATFFPN